METIELDGITYRILRLDESIWNLRHTVRPEYFTHAANGAVAKMQRDVLTYRNLLGIFRAHPFINAEGEVGEASSQDTAVVLRQHAESGVRYTHGADEKGGWNHMIVTKVFDLSYQYNIIRKLQLLVDGND